MLDMNNSQILFFNPLLLRGIIFEIQDRLVLFKKQILKSIRPSPNSSFNEHSPHGIKLLIRLRIGLSYLREYKWRHNFQDSLDPFFNCGRHVETIIHFLLPCSNYSNQRKALFDKFGNIKPSLLNQNDATVVETFLFG